MGGMGFWVRDSDICAAVASCPRSSSKAGSQAPLRRDTPLWRLVAISPIALIPKVL